MTRRLFHFSVVAIVLLSSVALVERGLSNLYWNAARGEPPLHQQIKRNKSVVLGPDEYDALILGDSTGTHGIIPDLLEELTGLRSYNLATTSTDAPIGDLYFLSEYLDRHAPPKAIIVVRAVDSWGLNTPDDLIREHFEKAQIRWLLYRKGFSPLNRFITSFVAGFVPSFDRRYNLHRILFASPPLVTPDMFLRSPTVHLETDSTRGYIRIDGFPSDADPVKVVQSAEQDIGAYVPTDQNLALLQALCDMATQHHVPAIFLSSPYIAAAESSAAFHESMRKLDDRIKGVLADQSNCSWHGPQAFPNIAMSDLIHTNVSGAIIFTHQVAEHLGTAAALDQ